MGNYINDYVIIFPFIFFLLFLNIIHFYFLLIFIYIVF